MHQAVQLQKIAAEAQAAPWATPCGFDGCNRAAEATFHRCSLCVQHFIFACYVRLDKCKKHGWVSEGAGKQRADLGFLIHTAEQSLRLFEHRHGIENLERARLYDIHLWASELLAHRHLFAENFVETGS